MKDRDSTERLFYLGIGPLAALVLGMALVPLRDFTMASNFTFVFLVLTIVVAVFGHAGPSSASRVSWLFCSARERAPTADERLCGCGATE